MQKVTACMIALNEAEFIEQNLRHHLSFPWIDQIIVVEGAVEKYMHAADTNGHSRDGTLDLIRKVRRDHPEGKKIEIHTGKWKDKREQRSKYIESIRNGWMLLIDADEFYMEEEIRKVAETAQEKNASCIIYPHIHFWHDFWHYGYAKHWHKTQLRFSRFEPGWGYNVHYTLCDKLKKNIQWDDTHKASRWYTHNTINLAYPEEDLAPNILDFDCSIYHYGYARNREYVADKLMFYRRRDKSNKASDADLRKSVMETSGWFDKRWFKGENCDPETVKKYKGTHPGGIQAHPRHSEVLIND